MFLALQPREGWRKAWGGMGDGERPGRCRPCPVTGDRVVEVLLPMCSLVLSSCLSSTALRSLFLYIVILIVPCSPYPVFLLSLQVDAGGYCLSSTCTCACVPFWSFLFSLQVSFCSCVQCCFFFSSFPTIFGTVE